MATLTAAYGVMFNCPIWRRYISRDGRKAEYIYICIYIGIYIYIYIKNTGGAGMIGKQVSIFVAQEMPVLAMSKFIMEKYNLSFSFSVGYPPMLAGAIWMTPYGRKIRLEGPNVRGGGEFPL